ncbi:MAG: M18 family aminopeptidase [Gammaproteobacteria bacterium]|nr:M18 family aminopeptidase [Gammaproteobacteria bacterium]
MKHNAFNFGLLAFLDASPTPFHATATLLANFKQAGFTVLEESAEWKLRVGGRYCVTRNGSSLLAFTLGKQPLASSGIRMVGAHTDSPCLKLKPNPELHTHGYQQLGVEVYGGVLLNPWFDRDLALAGRVTCELKNGKLVNRLVDFRRALATIPSLAIHLDREANDKRTINKQTYLPPVIGRLTDDEFSLNREITAHVRSVEPKLAIAAVRAFELCFYDLQGAAQIGWCGEFIASARLDNLLSCYTGMRALIDSPHDTAQLLICNDHEEVGSGSTSGARGNFLESVLQRLTDHHETLARAMAQSMLVSTDNAHGIHPNFADKHDAKHGPLLNLGPALKTNANQSYATNSESAAVIQHAAARANVTLQAFVARADMGCGSTIGPLAATRLGVRTVDVGVPTFAMHSIRELAGSADAYALYRVVREFFALESVAVA